MASRHRPPKTLQCSDHAEIVLRLPRGGVLVVAAGEYELHVRAGSVRGATSSPKSSPRTPDLRVERALKALRAELGRRWSVGELAKLAGLSRAAFTRAFRAATGESPMQRVARERLERAAELLGDAATGLAEIAARVGYANEFALSRAFKRHFGLPPAIFRKALTGGNDVVRCAA